VLVLVPGGTAEIGSPRPDMTGSTGDPLAREHEFPRMQIDLVPFFLSKYELTQEQWERLAGSNPSYLPIASATVPLMRASHPVDTVSWEECLHVLGEGGFVLPTEAQWEYAARAGTRTRWWSGDEPGSLEAASGSRESSRVFGGPPNPWGFHHILGNVAEWTRDAYLTKRAGALRAGDGLALGSESGLRVVRGGSFFSPAAELRCAAREERPAGTRSADIGVRPARMPER
jgi:formylglycine-generating enzyme required for sulfatase activity